MNVRVLLLLGLLLGLPGPPASAGAAEREKGAAEENLSTREWAARLRQWRAEIDPAAPREAPRRAAAEEKIAAIDDPIAVRPLALMLERDTSPVIQLMLLGPLGRIGTDDALKALVKASVESRSTEVRRHAAQQISNLPNRQDAIPHYLGYLRSDKFSALAAQALLQSTLAEQDKRVRLNSDLVYALIDAITVTAKRRVPVPYHYDTGRRVTSVGPGGGLSTSRTSVSGITTLPVELEAANPVVLHVLVKYTGVNYGYDQNAWRQWFQRDQNARRRAK
jgi:hypothetical protein